MPTRTKPLTWPTLLRRLPAKRFGPGELITFGSQEVYVTRTRQMMLEELQRRNYSEETIRTYIRAVEQHARYFGKPPDKLGLDHLRTCGRTRPICLRLAS